MALLEDIDKYFGTKNLYEVIGVDKNASNAEIKKGYRKLSLKVHPDRVEESEKATATEKFQILSKVHFILNDCERRKLYDEQGIVDDEECSEQDWYNYWRNLFPKVSAKDITSFKDNYVGSQEEIEDLTRIYEKYEGDMDKISQFHIFFDEDRVNEQLKSLIEQEKIEAYDNFCKEPESKKKKRVRKAQKEAKEAAKLSNDLGSLEAMIKGRREKSNVDFLASLEEKYSRGTKRKRYSKE